ncbi:MAG TPA: hypothetical protein DEQ02_10535 [Ruminococcaceae bacterium]|nr:hypothetical protein [Oscillospiraceae bacterium]
MRGRKIKCVVWDLDETVWRGILSEGDDVKLRPKVPDIMRGLDERGILQSVCSKNDFDQAWSKLDEMGLSYLFIYPQISWNPKSMGVKEIAKLINIAQDAIAFVDDQEFELAEVGGECPNVMCINSADLDGFLEMDEMNPRFITEDSTRRRLLYQDDIKRGKIEDSFVGTKDEFLRTLDMKLTISLAVEGDLKRAEELTVRTHQLNSTGDVYSYEQLRELIGSQTYEVLIVQLDDKYGTYGKIGLALIEKDGIRWELKLLLMSCRVISRGVGGVILSYLVNKAISNGAELFARFVPSDRNRIMYISYKFGGFREDGKKGDCIILKADTSKLRVLPDYIAIEEG